MRLILTVLSAVLRQLGTGMVAAGSVLVCGNLFISCARLAPEPQDQRADAQSPTPPAPLTPDEERAWGDLVSRLVSHD
jgi:hypothetical protein